LWEHLNAMPHAIVLDKRIEYRMILGNAGKPTLVFLHEGLGCVALWREFPDRLAKALGCPAVVYSRLGYGQSDGLNAGTNHRRNARFMHDEALVALPALLDALGVQNPILVGHSDGASIALIHAASSGRPVAGLVLMAPHVFVEAVTVTSIAKIAETYETTDLRQRLTAYHSHVDDAFRGWADIWLSPTFRTWSLGAEVQALRVPTLVIQGEDDEYGTLAQVDAISEAAPGPVTRCVLANCRHSPHRDQEKVVIAAVKAWECKLEP
jgi:pimeloyl-ACP methyl ester carboxylesterase